jgi:hypothetical protein
MRKFTEPKSKSLFVLLLYIAVLGISAFHHHAPDYPFFGNSSVKGANAPRSTHNSATSYSACVMVAFAGTSSLTENRYILNIIDRKIFFQAVDRFNFVISQRFNTSLLRAPPFV